MDRLKHSLLVLALLFFYQNSIAQNESSTAELTAIDAKINESIFITPNTNSYLTGETLRYKLFCLNKLNNTISANSKIAYVELIDQNLKSIFTHKLFLEKGTANGDFFIPTTLVTGNYKLIGYTKWMLNKAVSDYFNIDVYIINPYESKKNSNSQTQIKNTEETKYIATETVFPSNNKNSNINLELAKKVYSSRENIDLKIKTNSNEYAKGTYALSIRKIDGLLSKNKLSFDEYTVANANRKTDNTIVNENFALPELRGEIISGKIVPKTSNNSVGNKNIAISIPGKNFEVKISKTSQDGRFLFILDKPFSNPNIIIQLIDADKEEYAIEIDKPKTPNYSGLIFNNDIIFNANLNKNVKERAISSQIENAYYSITKDSLATIKNAIKFYEPLEKDYILDDFTRFPTLKEMTVEIVSEMYYTKNNNKYELYVNDHDPDHELTIPPLILVDGLLIQDINELFEYKMSNIYKISIYSGGYYYGAKLFDGLISFTSKNFDYNSKLSGSFIIKPEILRPLPKKNYYQPDYSNKSLNERIPDYRYQLLWQPDLSIENNEKTVSFYTSDVTGTFEISLEGFTDQGKPVILKDTFQVQ